MSLRDYFIAHAPAREIKIMEPIDIKACAEFLGIPVGEYRGEIHFWQVLAKLRCQWADAMLEERSK